jgi:hypothetical protein
MSTWRRRTVYCEGICRLGCAFQIRRDPRSPKLASDWAVKLWNRSPASPNRIRSLLGAAGWSPGSSMVQTALVARSWNWWFKWQERTLAGVTIGLLELLANLGHAVSDQTVGNILRCHGLAPAPKRSQNPTWKDFIANPYGGPGRSRLLYRRSAHEARFGHVLRLVLPSS